MTNLELGEAIKRERILSGATQEDLAVTAQITKSVLAQFEVGLRRPNAEVLQRILDALAITKDRLAGKSPLQCMMRRRGVSHSVRKIYGEQYEAAVSSEL